MCALPLGEGGGQAGFVPRGAAQSSLYPSSCLRTAGAGLVSTAARSLRSYNSSGSGNRERRQHLRQDADDEMRYHVGASSLVRYAAGVRRFEPVRSPESRAQTAAEVCCRAEPSRDARP